MKKTGKIALLAVILLSLSGIVLWQFFYIEKINYYITCVSVLVLSMLPFFLSFEIKSISSREITLIATLIAIAVMSRAAFYLIPQVKPIAAVVIVSAACFGAHRGYIVGAFSAFISNFIFGQGIWTPFQMVALGMVGLISGIVFSKVNPNRYILAGVGFILAFALYGAIVDASTVLIMCGDNLTLSGIFAIYAAGVPFSFVFGLSTAVFLFLFGEAFITKIDRINKKFGIVSGQ